MLIIFFAATAGFIAAMWFGLVSRQRGRGVASSNSPDSSWLFMDSGSSASSGGDSSGGDDCGSASDGGGSDCGGDGCGGGD